MAVSSGRSLAVRGSLPPPRLEAAVDDDVSAAELPVPVALVSVVPVALLPPPAVVPLLP